MQKTISEVFGFPAPASAVVTVRDDTAESPHVPVLSKEYIFRKEILSDFLAWVAGAAGDDPIYLTGPTATGKSSTVEQVAAALQQPLYVVSCHEAMEAPEFMGRYVVKDGSMMWQDGPLVAGLKDPLGAWIFLDEMDTVRPGASMVLNALVEGRNTIIPETGELLNPRQYGAKIICAGNTAGMDDESGMYAGTNRQNLALMGRFMMVKMGYPEPDDEQKIIHGAVPDLPEDIVKAMIQVANDVRKVYESGETEVVFCTRSLRRWGKLFCLFRKTVGVDPLHHSLDRAIGYKLSPEAQAGLHEMVQRVFGKTAINKKGTQK
jgi:cobaltochelatase CobS